MVFNIVGYFGRFVYGCLNITKAEKMLSNRQLLSCSFFRSLLSIKVDYWTCGISCLHNVYITDLISLLMLKLHCSLVLILISCFLKCNPYESSIHLVKVGKAMVHECMNDFSNKCTCMVLCRLSGGKLFTFGCLGKLR